MMLMGHPPYAHTPNDRGKWHLLEDRLLEVADFAGREAPAARADPPRPQDWPGARPHEEETLLSRGQTSRSAPFLSNPEGDCAWPIVTV
jgi:hypothetical protein